MPRFYFKKLVRDQVLQRCLEDPKVQSNYRILDSLEFKTELVAKIHEEATEIPILDHKDDEILSEIADVQAVIDSLVAAYGYTQQEVAAAMDKKATKNGTFEKRAYIEYVDLDNDSQWNEYFRKSPEKYKEDSK